MENKLKTISFQPRESSLTSLINTNQDVRSFMNLISAFVYRLSTIIPVQYYIDRQVFYSDVNFILWCFSSFYIFIIYDILLHFMVISIFYPVAKIFRSNQLVSVCTLISTMVIMTLLILQANVTYEMSPVLKFALLAEKIRLMMKMTSFVTSPRTHSQSDTVKNETNGVVGNAGDALNEDTLGTFIYFLFAPTLLYRTSYPRTKSIDWSNVTGRATHLAAALFMTMLFMTRFLIPTFSKIGPSMVMTDVMNMVFVANFCGVFSFWMIFYGFFESYLNLTAELTKFSDRQFYRDFWNFTDIVDNFRRWNTITHNFIHECIYSPIVICVGSKKVATLFVVTLSTILHEYIMAISLGFSIPWIWIGSFWVLFLFGRPILQTLEQLNIFGSSDSDRNYTLFIGLVSTWGTLSFLYAAEYYSRINCPVIDESFYRKYFTLKAISCMGIKS